MTSEPSRRTALSRARVHPSLSGPSVLSIIIAHRDVAGPARYDPSPRPETIVRDFVIFRQCFAVTPTHLHRCVTDRLDVFRHARVKTRKERDKGDKLLDHRNHEEEWNSRGERDGRKEDMFEEKDGEKDVLSFSSSRSLFLLHGGAPTLVTSSSERCRLCGTGDERVGVQTFGAPRKRKD